MEMIPKIHNGFAFDINDDLVANYRLNPFDTFDIRFNKNLPLSTTIDDYLIKKFQHKNFIYTANGRHAIGIALEVLCLQPNDCITIFTTTGNKYISGCVTREIEKYCKWSRSIEKNTKALFVNHEFGFLYPCISTLREYNLPIIEDYCYSFHANGFENNPGHSGDFAIYSFAKYFPIQLGGLLVANDRYQLPNKVIDFSTEQYIKQVLSYYQNDIDNMGSKRRANYIQLTELLHEFNFIPRFSLTKTDDVPGVFIFRSPIDVNLQSMKDYLWSVGIHCSVFYGEQSFFIPVHHRLVKDDFDYFYACFYKFFKTMSDNL